MFVVFVHISDPSLFCNLSAFGGVQWVPPVSSHHVSDVRLWAKLAVGCPEACSTPSFMGSVCIVDAPWEIRIKVVK